jgi:transposase
MSHYYLGIDVSKGHADFLMLDEASAPVADGFQLDDTSTGHQCLEDWLQSFLTNHPQAEIYAAVESTGGYENNWYRFLKSLSLRLPIHVARLNAFWVNANAKAGGERNKTDQISAKDIANYLISHSSKVRYDVNDGYPTLRRQYSYIKLLSKQHTQLVNHLESQLYDSMPELLTLCKNGVPTYLITLLSRYPTYRAIHRAGVQKLSKIKSISVVKAEKILKITSSNHGSSNEISGQVIKSLADQIRDLNQTITSQKALLEKNYAEAQREVELLTSFKGIGIYSAVGLLLNIGNIENFASAKKLASYFGIHPIYRQSGDGSYGYHMSKQGRAEARAILYMVSFSAIQHNPIIKEVYANCLKKGMHKSAALGVCMHKILRIVFGMLKNNTPFHPETDRNNQRKHTPTSKQPQNNKKRRLQSYDNNAPVSRRQHKKRREQTAPHDDDIAVSGVTETAPENV